MRFRSFVFPLSVSLLFFGCATTRPAGPSPAAFSVEVKGKGAPVILIPGLMSSGDVWDGLVARLSTTHECHVLTVAGFAGQPAVDGPLLPQVADQLVSYIRDKGLQRPVLIGHSLGGTVAFMVAARAPDLVGRIVSVDGVPALGSLFAPDATPGELQAQAAQLRDRILPLTQEGLVDFERRQVGRLVANEDGRRAVLRWARKCDPRAVAQATYETLTTDVRADLARVTSPILLIAAAGYVQADAQAEEVKARYEAQLKNAPSHEVVLARRALHFIMFDDPAFLAEEVERFLGRGA